MDRITPKQRAVIERARREPPRIAETEPTSSALVGFYVTDTMTGPEIGAWEALIACRARRRAYLCNWVCLPFGPTRLPKGRWLWEFLSP